MTTNFPKRARRDDPHGHMVVQDNLDTLRDIFDRTLAASKGGSTAILAGTTTRAVAHGLGLAAYRVAVTPLSDPGSRWWVSGKSSSSFTLNLQSAPGTDINFDWYVKGD